MYKMFKFKKLFGKVRRIYLENGLNDIEMAE